VVKLDGRRPGVRLPQHLRRAELGLQLHFGHPWKGRGDLVANSSGIRETLLFARNPHAVAVPWSAVFGVSDASGEIGELYADDAPRQFLREREAVLLSDPSGSASAVAHRGHAPSGPREAAPYGRSSWRALALYDAAAPEKPGPAGAPRPLPEAGRRGPGLRQGRRPRRRVRPGGAAAPTRGVCA
jgi:hypothetical protein